METTPTVTTTTKRTQVRFIILVFSMADKQMHYKCEQQMNG